MKPGSPALQVDSLQAEINYYVFASLCSRNLSCALANTVNRKGSEQANCEYECWCDLICVPGQWRLGCSGYVALLHGVQSGTTWARPHWEWGETQSPLNLSRTSGAPPWCVSPCLECCVPPCSFSQFLSSQARLCIGALLHLASKGVSCQLGELASTISGQLACVCSSLFSRCGQHYIL